MRLSLDPNEIHVWRADLADLRSGVKTFARSLQVDEWRRADRFLAEAHRVDFVVARGVLRQLLSRYLDADPRAVSFTYGPYGKPALASTEEGSTDITFNVSHTAGLALYAIARRRRIGVDVERIVPVDCDALARDFFSADEQGVIHALPPARKFAAFFKCWTGKEALVKAIGEGLSLPLDTFTVSAVPEEPARLLHIEGDPSGPSPWRLTTLRPRTGHAATLAAEAGATRVCCWHWQA
jgi:4'-phosphopantetheinyl transferase